MARSQIRRASSRRSSTWGSVDVTTAAVAASAKVLLSRFTDATLQSNGASPSTVVRWRGMFHARSDQSASSELFQGAIGIAIVSEIAGAAGAASIPGPVTDGDWDGWFGWWGLVGEFELATAVGFDGDSGYRVDMDTKAMRKIPSDSSLVVMAENASGSTGFDITMQARALFKLT